MRAQQVFVFKIEAAPTIGETGCSAFRARADPSASPLRQRRNRF